MFNVFMVFSEVVKINKLGKRRTNAAILEQRVERP